MFAESKPAQREQGILNETSLERQNPTKETGELRALSQRLFLRFLLLGAIAGLLIGLGEGGMLFFIPSIRQFQVVDATYVIWFVTPLVDLALFLLVGAVLGVIAAAVKVHTPDQITVLMSLMFGAVGAHLGWSLHFLHTHSVNMHTVDHFGALFFPFVRFAAVFALALLCARFSKIRKLPLFDPARHLPLGKTAKVVIIFSGLSVCGLLIPAGLLRFFIAEPVGTPSTVSSPTPNVVLITLDTVRADHLSAYGYSRITTPNIDKLARNGVLFANAIASTSWTLPSLTSMFTGLLPHQQGADSFRPVNLGLTTLAEELSAHGYQTAGFNSNYVYGQAGWGVAQGFGTYDDAEASTSYNLSRTLFGRALLQPIFQTVENYDAFYRRDAEDMNGDIRRWFRRRRPGPFFLFVNFFDAHRPYLAPAPYDKHFGEISAALVRKTFSFGSRPSEPLGPGEQASLINSYDNCLAYLDAQVGELLKFLKTSPDWSNTVVILTSDHGEAFGEHEAYGHGYNLNREVIHVPLIMFGRGIPAGERIIPAASLRGLFASILDITLGNSLPLHDFSLARFWQDSAGGNLQGEAIVSELGASLAPEGEGTISLVASNWHYIRTKDGREELFDWMMDPQERRDLSRSATNQDVLNLMRDRLLDSVDHSLHPWLGGEYLSAVNQPGNSLRSASRRPQPPRSDVPEGVGAEQALVNPEWMKLPVRPAPSQRELLESLPYQ